MRDFAYAWESSFAGLGCQLEMVTDIGIVLPSYFAKPAIILRVIYLEKFLPFQQPTIQDANIRSMQSSFMAMMYNEPCTSAAHG